jgi:hypothetical protein
MKKNIFLTALVVTALLSSSAFAKKASTKEERMGALASFVAMGVVSAAVHAGGKATGMSSAAMNTVHAANVLYSIGQVTDREVLRDLGLRTLVAGGAAKVASLPQTKQLLPYVPLVGESLAKAEGYGVGIVTVLNYKAFGYGYEWFIEKTGMRDFLGLGE